MDNRTVVKRQVTSYRNQKLVKEENVPAFYRATFQVKYTKTDPFTKYSRQTSSIDLYFESMKAKGMEDQSVESMITKIGLIAAPEILSRVFKTPYSKIKMDRLLDIKKLGSGDDIPQDRLIKLDKYFDETSKIVGRDI